MYTVWFRKSSRSYTNNQCTSFRQPWRIWFFRDTLIVEVLKGLKKSCGGFQYVSLLITIFNHKILIHDLEFLHFCKEHNKFIIKLLININPQKPILYRVPFYIGVTTMSVTNIKILSNHYFIFKNRNFII